MTSSFANRLAAGGVWVIKFAGHILRYSEDLRERGIGPLLVGDGSPRQVFNYAGRDAFNWLVQGYLPEGHRAHVDMELLDTKYFNRNGIQISEELWLQHLQDENYRQVAYSRSRGRNTEVVTIWTGLCINGDPNVFRTLVFRPCTSCSKPHPAYLAMSATERRAISTHLHIIKEIEAGRM